MVSAEGEVSAQEVLPEVMGGVYHGQELTTSHTVIPLWLGQSSASIGNDSLAAIFIMLGQHCSNNTVTYISVQDEGLAEVRECQDRC